ncbi:hemolysin XhlA [Lelliottia wanjuensis]|uniref:Hemolysin XhlA n=1 Tax=Lelliottia wanjuensis TaxID=3050585 RepID=A0AAP4FTR0_9ENTR|nr:MULTISPECIES: hemolysin XhlA [unclassified Lelliottia]MDK9364206.1 hemolysin XhlA [Lelliottia sp. V106_12]MDK9617117.1 hemolysin XhlA [Lelliottia sp. V106_9]
MLTRVKKLEDDLQTLKTDVAVMRSNYSTKEDVMKSIAEMHSAMRVQTWSIVGALITAIGIAAGIIIKFS